MAAKIFIIPSCSPVSEITLTSFALMKLFISILSILFDLNLYGGSGEIELASEKFLKAILQV